MSAMRCSRLLRTMRRMTDNGADRPSYPQTSRAAFRLECGGTADRGPLGQQRPGRAVIRRPRSVVSVGRSVGLWRG